MRKQAIALIRVSTEGQAADDRAGIPAQRAAIHKTAQRYGLEIVRTIELVDVSGARILTAPETAELFRLMELPEMHGVIAKEFSRLMRPQDLSDFAILQRFIETQTVLYLPDGPVDFSNKSGRLFGGIRALMAGFERQEVLERMNDAKEQMRRQGKNTGGASTLPYGVTCSGAEWSYTAEAQKVREAFRMVLTTTKPYARIAEELNIGRTNLRFILSNPIYTGWRIYDQKRDPRAAAYVPGPKGRQGYRRKMERPAEEVIRVRVLEPLIPQEIFDRVQQTLKARAAREREVRSKNKPQYTFNGFLYCAACESPMYSHTNQKDRHFYCKQNGTRARKRNPASACPTPYIRAAVIEPKIEQLLSDRLQDDDFLERVAAAMLTRDQQPSGAVPDHAAVGQQMEVLSGKRSRVLEAYFDGAISRKERDDHLNRIGAEIESYRRVGGQSVQPRPRIDARALAEVLAVFAEMPYLQREQKRSLLHGLGIAVFVEGYTIKQVAMRNIGGLSCHSGRRSKMAMSASHAHPCR